MIVIAGALLGASAYFAYKYLQGMRNAAATSLGGAAGDDPYTKQYGDNDELVGYDDLINKIVDSVVFSTQERVVGKRKIGERLIESEIPADEIQVRKMRSMSELPKVLPKAQALPEDIFYGMAAGNKLPVMQYMEKLDIIEPEMGPPHNVLLVLQDVSGSMQEHQRFPWSIKLNKRLVDRCILENADYVLVLFDYSVEPDRQYIAHGNDELKKLRGRLSRIIYGNGGTDIDNALQEAIKFLDEGDFDDKRIILVTDGDDCVNIDLRSDLDEQKFNLHTVCIANENYDLRSISDRYDVLKEKEEN